MGYAEENASLHPVIVGGAIKYRLGVGKAGGTHKAPNNGGADVDIAPDVAAALCEAARADVKLNRGGAMFADAMSSSLLPGCAAWWSGLTSTEKAKLVESVSLTMVMVGP